MKQVKITIILDQPLQGKHTEEVTRAILGDKMAYGAYKSFSQDRVTVEEIDTDEEATAIAKAEALWPCKELSDKLAAGKELTPKEDVLLFRNMDKQMAFFAGRQWTMAQIKKIRIWDIRIENSDYNYYTIFTNLRNTLSMTGDLLSSATEGSSLLFTVKELKNITRLLDAYAVAYNVRIRKEASDGLPKTT